MPFYFGERGVEREKGSNGLNPFLAFPIAKMMMKKGKRRGESGEEARDKLILGSGFCLHESRSLSFTRSLRSKRTEKRSAVLNLVPLSFSHRQLRHLRAEQRAGAKGRREREREGKKSVYLARERKRSRDAVCLRANSLLVTPPDK